MRSLPTVGIYLDPRYQNSDGFYSIKIRVTYCRQSRFYKTGIFISKGLFKKTWKAKQPQGKNLQIKEELDAIRIKAKKVISKMDHFTFQEFESNWFDKSFQKNNVFLIYDKVIENLNQEGKYSTAELYSLSKSKVEEFYCKNARKSLPFYDITASSLSRFEQYLLNQGKSNSTISIYLRCLRRIFNTAIELKTISDDTYPFQRRNSQHSKYKIPKERNVKRALSISQLKSLVDFPVIQGSPVEKAKYFWLLSFYCQGINFVDLLTLKNRDYCNGKIVTYRKKTTRSKSMRKKLEIIVPNQASIIIDQFRNESQKPDDFLFPVLHGAKLSDQRRLIKNFTRMINQHVKKIANKLDLPKNLSSIWARHTYATIAKNRGATVEFISEALGHSNIRTTHNYLDSFEDNIKKEMTERILEGL